MKRIFLFFVLAVGFNLALSAQVEAVEAADQAVEDTQEALEGAKMEFEKTTIDYGTIEQGSDPYRIFTFTNTGNAPLVITNAKGSCGCTVPTYPKEPIPPAQSGEIKVRYDTNRVGPFTKRVTLTTNASDEPIVLTIKGKVEPKAEEPEGVPSEGGNMFNSGGF
ncbi:MAG: DUF1573 domain-containing protein [Bacteroidetes bacterium]|nr:MAG: DUF1573 domain-containing protein [Bacteroidota bacterium]